MSSNPMSTRFLKAHEYARHRLQTAQANRTFPTVRPGCLRIFQLLGMVPRSIGEMRPDLSGAVNDIREDLELLAFALLVYAPGTVTVERSRDPKATRGGSNEYRYALVVA